MLLIDTLLIGVIAIAVFNQKQTENAEQAELIPIPVRDKELKDQEMND